MNSIIAGDGSVDIFRKLETSQYMVEMSEEGQCEEELHSGLSDLKYVSEEEEDGSDDGMHCIESNQSPANAGSSEDVNNEAAFLTKLAYSFDSNNYPENDEDSDSVFSYSVSTFGNNYEISFSDENTLQNLKKITIAVDNAMRKNSNIHPALVLPDSDDTMSTKSGSLWSGMDDALSAFTETMSIKNENNEHPTPSNWKTLLTPGGIHVDDQNRWRSRLALRGILWPIARCYCLREDDISESTDIGDHPYPESFVPSHKGPLHNENIEIPSGTAHAKLKCHEAAVAINFKHAKLKCHESAVAINFNQHISRNSALKERNMNETAHCDHHRDRIPMAFVMIP